MTNQSYAAAAFPPAAEATTVDGIHYLLGRGKWGEFVARYSKGELAEVFSATDRAALAAGKEVWLGQAVWRDMVAATRIVAG